MNNSSQAINLKWIEMIRVRSTADVLQGNMPGLIKQVREIETAADVHQVFIMTHALYHGDLSVVLVWLKRDKPEKSLEGLLLAERLQALGSVDHAVWIPTPKTMEPNKIDSTNF